MQLFIHKNTNLTVCQKFFIEKSLELLYAGTIDSYRVRLNNSKSILEELNYCLKEFSKGRIKHFHTIKAKEKESKAIVDEAIVLLEADKYLVFNSFSKEYFKQLLLNTNEHNYKKVISCINILLSENANYLQNSIRKVEELINENATTINSFQEIDRTLNTIFSELISKGFSKGFLYKLVYGIFVNTLDDTKSFATHFNNFKSRILNQASSYQVVFRIDTTLKVYEAISTINANATFQIRDNINDISVTITHKPELNRFNATASSRKFIICNVDALDYLSALKKARITLSEYLDVINLGLSDETLDIHNRVLVIDSRSPEKGAFQNNINFLDGKYKVAKEHYQQFTAKIPLIISNPNIAPETKEKIKSAIRYLRLGNQSTEVEHKFINYWIGLEYLFSNYESNSTIFRLKEHFIIADSLAYVKRNVYSFYKAFNQLLNTATKSSINKYTDTAKDYLLDPDFYTDIEDKLLEDYPLLVYRAMKLKSWFFKADKTPNATEYITMHKNNLEIHFTRIYRLRNEIIHDAVTNTNNEQITSNLRYYLTFILNELIDYFSVSHTLETSIEDFFILNELKMGNIKQGGYQLHDLMNINCSIDFIS